MKQKIKKIFTNKYFVGTILVILLYTMYLVISRVTPFGENSILKSDSYKQYAEFLAYYRGHLYGKKSLLLSWNMGLGNNFFTTFTYYLVSPFNLLVVFFNEKNIYIFFELVILLKLILIFNFMELFLSKNFVEKSKFSVLFALSYTFRSFAISYMFHIMWLDALYMLPVICIAIKTYFEKGKIAPFIALSALNILFNYYMGFITLFFSGVYFTVQLIAKERMNESNKVESDNSKVNSNLKSKNIENTKSIEEKSLNKNNKFSNAVTNFSVKLKIKIFIKFVLGCFVAIGISMVFFLPSFMQVKGVMESGIDLWNFQKQNAEYFSNIIFNNHSYSLEQRAGLIFSSSLVTILIPMYFMNKKISKREKIWNLLLIIFMILPVFSPILNKLWHGMTEPNCFYYRFDFCLVFFLVTISYETFLQIEGNNKKHVILCTLIITIITIAEIYLNQKGILERDNIKISLTSILISYAICLGFLIIIINYLKTKDGNAENKNIETENIESKNEEKIEFELHDKESNQIESIENTRTEEAKIAKKENKIRNKKLLNNILETALTILIVADLGFSMNSYKISNPDNFMKAEYVTQYDGIADEILKDIENKESERVIFNPEIDSMNFSSKYGYSTIDYFTSARNKKTIRNMYALGYNIQRDDGLWLRSYSGNWVSYSMAGVKLIVTKEKLENENSIYGFELVEQYGDYYIYKSNLNIPFAYQTNGNIQVEEVDNAFYEQSQNPFEIQNKILQNIENANNENSSENKTLSNQNKNKNKVSKENNNENYLVDINKPSNILEVEKETKKKEESQDTELQNVGETTEESKEAEEEKYITTYKVKALKDTSICLFSDSNLQLYKNDKPQFEDYANIWSTETGIRQICNLKKGETYEFKIEAKKESKYYVYVLDNEKIKNAIQKAQSKVSNATINKNKVTITVNNQTSNSKETSNNTEITNQPSNETTKTTNYLAFEIPYDEGWRAKINGTPVEVKKFNAAFLGIELQEGENKIELYYIPRYLRLGMLVSFISLIVLMFIEIKEINELKNNK